MERRAHSATGGVRRALVVDDDRLVAETLAEVVRCLGYEANVVGSVAEARVAIGEARYVVILSELQMPHEHGIALASWLRAHPEAELRRTPAVAVSALGNRDEALAAGFCDFVRKPYGVSDIRSVLMAIVNTPLDDSLDR